MAATIDIISSTGTVKHSAVFESESVRKFELMKEDYVRLVFSTSERFTISLGDKIVIGEDFDPALRGTFVITEPQAPTYNTNTGGYDYDLQFNAEHYKWNNKLFKFEPSTKRNEANWSLTDTLRSHMAVFLRNLEFYGWEEYTVDESSYSLEAASRNIFIQYNNKKLLDALTQIAEAFECEWWISNKVIYFGKCETGSLVDFEVGVNVEDMGSEKGEKEYITRLYAFGSDRNIPPDYRNSDEQVLMNGVVQKRVMLPEATPYVDIVDGLTTDEIVEGIVTFDDVYPRLDCAITDLQTDIRTVKDETSDDEDATVDVPIYRFKDSSLQFSSDYILAGETLQVQFQSGPLNGMIFDVAFNPDDVDESTDDGQWFEIIRNETYGLYLPNDTLKPEKTNSFVLIGWNVKKIQSGLSLVTAAEKELLERTQTYAEKLQIDPNTYPCKMMADYMYGLDRSGNQDSNYTKVGSFPLGQKIRLINETFFDGGSRQSRVVGFEYKIDKPYDGAVIYVGESATYSRNSATDAKINEAMDAINYQGSNYTAYGGSSSVYIITTNDDTSPSDGTVYSSLKTERSFARKDQNDSISSLWTFNHGNGARRGIQSKDYNENGSNEDNLFGKGFELIEKTDSNGDRRTRLEVDELLVRIKAFFASLEIREISYVGGNYAFSAAGSRIYFVEWLDGTGNILNKVAANLSQVARFRCYLYSDDGTTATENRWAEDDQALCETFNIDSGVHTSTSNKRYWRRVLATGKGIIPSMQETQSEDEETTLTEFQYVDLSNLVSTDYETGSDYPEAEDAIVQMGNWTNSARQGIIYLMVEGTNAPAIMEYSGVGADGKHFQLPDPTLLLSPKKNVIYGEFHSVVDEESGNSGEGDTIEDQLKALIEQLNDVKNQADKKFDIWFGSGTPLPLVTFTEVTAESGDPATNGWYECTDTSVYALSEDTEMESGKTYYIKTENTETNYPVTVWTTESLKALHAQDIFYDTTRTPASTGGRAWRYVALSIDGVTVYRWIGITDADTLASLEKIADVAGDGIITGGAEKIRVYTDWKKAVVEHDEYLTRAEDYGITTEWTVYHNAFLALARMLNGGSDLGKNSNGDWETPAWLSDLYADTTITSPVLYRGAWTAYYDALATFVDALSEKAKDLIDDIVSDGVISGGTEKCQLYIEWVKTKDQYFDYYARSTAYGFKTFSTKDTSSKECGYYQDDLAFEQAFDALVLMLNGGQTEVVKNYTNRTVLLADGSQLEWLQNLQSDTTISNYSYNGTAYSAEIYRQLWNTYYYAAVKLLNDFTEYSKSLADEALSQLSDIASDGVVTPSEKNVIILNWQEIVAELPLLYNQATAFISGSTTSTSMAYSLTTARSSYVSCFETLADILNDDETYEYDISTKTFPTPSWLDTYLERTEELTAAEQTAFNNAWDAYFAARTTLQDLLLDAAKMPGDDALGELDNLAADSILTPFEKLTVIREWDAAFNEYQNLTSQATKAHITSETAYTNFNTAYYCLGNYLYDKTNDSTNRHINFQTMIGSYLLDDGDTTIDGDTFKSLWSDYYATRSNLISAIGNKHVAYFVSDSGTLPTPPYNVGDLWYQTDLDNMMVCVTAKESGATALATDWADLSDITEKRDPRLLLAAMVNMMYSYNGGYIREKSSEQYMNIYLGEKPSVGHAEGDLCYDGSSLWQYIETWESISNETLRMSFKAVYELTGIYTIRVFRTRPTITPQLYDIVCSPVTFTDTNLPTSSEYRTVEGGIQIQMYNGTDWEILQESQHSIIENLSGYVRALAMKSAGDYSTAAGFITRADWATLFASAEDGYGNKIAEANLSAYVQKDSEGKIVSGVSIDADQVNLTGSDTISLAITSAVAGAKQYRPNLLAHSIINEASTDYGFAHRSLRLEAGKKYTLSASGIVPTTLPTNMTLRVYIWRYKDSSDTSTSSDIGTAWASGSSYLTITQNEGSANSASCQITPDKTAEYHIAAYLYNERGTGNRGTRTYAVTCLWYKVEEGATATPWVPNESDENGLDNFIVNPLAVSATQESSCSGTATFSEITDSVFGKVLQVTHNVDGHWQLTFTRRSNYSLLTDYDATFFVICKNMATSNDAYVTNSDSTMVRSKLRMGDSNQVNVIDTTTSQFVDLGNGWRKYYATKRMTSELGSTVGICHVMGTWQIYAVGIVKGGVCPLVTEIMAKNNLLSTGIDITAGTIALRADKVTFENADGTISGKVWIDSTDGTLHATGGEFDGYIKTFIIDVADSDATQVTLDTDFYGWLLNTDLNLEVDYAPSSTIAGAEIILPTSASYVGKRVILWNGCTPPYTRAEGAVRYSGVRCEDGSKIMGCSGGVDDSSIISWSDPVRIEWINGIIELVGVPKYWRDSNGDKYVASCEWCVIALNAVSFNLYTSL